jgi:ABC-type ATPase involved in cell division
VAVARAVAGDPMIILADEPTGSLDDESAATIFHLLEMFYHRGATVVVATHDKAIIENARPVACFRSARVVWIRRRISEPEPCVLNFNL